MGLCVCVCVSVCMCVPLCVHEQKGDRWQRISLCTFSCRGPGWEHTLTHNLNQHPPASHYSCIPAGLSTQLPGTSFSGVKRLCSVLGGGGGCLMTERRGVPKLPVGVPERSPPPWLRFELCWLCCQLWLRELRGVGENRHCFARENT